MISSFWNWYERNLKLNLTVAAALFTLQLFHLYWLTADVVLPRLGFESLFPVGGILQLILLFVDYTEIPAILTTSLVYINEYRKTKSLKSILYLLFLNSQWIHILWITDEFVVETFTGSHVVGIPSGPAWIAIAIDYLELPVIYDTIKKVVKTKSLEPLKED